MFFSGFNFTAAKAMYITAMINHVSCFLSLVLFLSSARYKAYNS